METRGDCDLLDLTEKVVQAVRSSGIRSGIALVYVGGSTAGITTMEFEPGLAVLALPPALQILTHPATPPLT